MERTYLKTSLLIFLIVFGVSQATWGQNQIKIVENFTPVLEWDCLDVDADSFTVQISSREKDNEHTRHKIISCTYKVPTNFLKNNRTYSWKVIAKKRDISPGTVLKSGSFTTETICHVGKDEDDSDCDGISDDVENFIGTSPEAKTLFIKPIDETPFQPPKYWQEFIGLFPAKQRNGFGGFAEIPQLTEAGIEVVVIGAENHEYDKFNEFEYNPDKRDDKLIEKGLSEGKLPCKIMEIKAPIDNTSCNSGTFLYYKTTYENGKKKYKYVWQWAIGIASVDGHYPLKHTDPYLTPRIDIVSIDNYFGEGAYEEGIKENNFPMIKNCSKFCEEEKSCDKISPLNLNDKDSPQSPPFDEIPDDTVEFAPIEFDGDGKITNVPSKIIFVKNIIIKPDSNHIELISNNSNVELKIMSKSDSDLLTRALFFDVSEGDAYIKPYSKYAVKKRVIVHEIGHALMVGTNDDHCQNPNCIMYNCSINWEELKFGPPCESDEKCCEHCNGEGRDIRAFGAVYNPDYNQPDSNQ